MELVKPTFTEQTACKNGPSLFLQFEAWNLEIQTWLYNYCSRRIPNICKDIVAIYEIRWKGKGVINKNNYTVYFSGN